MTSNCVQSSITCTVDIRQKQDYNIHVNMDMFLKGKGEKMKRPARISQKELIQRLELESGEEVKTLEQWLDYTILLGEKGYGALNMPFFFQHEIDVIRKIKKDVEPISNRLYVTESAMIEQIELIVEYNSIWRKRMLSLQNYHSDNVLYENSLNNIVVLPNKQDDIL